MQVINLNDLANAMKPIVLPGEGLTVKLIKRGEEPGQGVGYLDDGTMVVTEQGAYHLGETVKLTVTSVLQTSAGRMIFGRIDPVSGPKSSNTHPPLSPIKRARVDVLGRVAGSTGESDPNEAAGVPAKRGQAPRKPSEPVRPPLFAERPMGAQAELSAFSGLRQRPIWRTAWRRR